MKVKEVELLCTLGPASLNDRVIHWLERAGTSLLRLNLSHTRIEDVERIVAYIQKRTRIPVCLDTEGAQVRTGPLVDGKITVRENRFLTARARPAAGDQSAISFYPGYIVNQLQVGDFISIDFNAFAHQASQAPIAAKAKELHTLLPNRRLVLGIDRLDYTKGIPHRIHAFHNLLKRYPQMQGKVSLIQVVVPSRVGIRQYDELKTTIEQLVGQVNGEFMRPGGWVPVWYFFGDLTRTELLAYYRAADIALITPLKDGMNLVAKEYCASNVEANGVLILSEFAGSAAQLRRSALLVNPYDIEGVADTLLQAYELDPKERQRRMRTLRRSIRDADVFWWLESFMRAAFTKNLDDFPLPDGHAPDAEDHYFGPD